MTVALPRCIVRTDDPVIEVLMAELSSFQLRQASYRALCLATSIYTYEHAKRLPGMTDALKRRSTTLPATYRLQNALAMRAYTHMSKIATDRGWSLDPKVTREVVNMTQGERIAALALITGAPQSGRTLAPDLGDIFFEIPGDGSGSPTGWP